MKMHNRVENFIEENKLLSKEHRVTVALSGGADSVALLKILLSLGYNVSALHVNHNLRGKEADRDEAFCRKLCKELGVLIEVVSVDVKAYAKEKGISTETAARELRYDALCRADSDAVATAHTMSDNAETVIFNLIRGSALSGLCGIPLKIEKCGKLFVRPIMCLSREETEEIAGEYVTDSTNNEDDATRNRIRHYVIPLLKRENPALEESVLKNSFILRDEDEFLKKSAEGIEISAEALKNAPNVLAMRRIKKLLEENALPVNSIYISDILALAHSDNPSASVDVGGARIRREYDRIIVDRGKTAVELCETGLTYGVNVLSDGSKLILEEKTGKINNLFTTFYVDKDKIYGTLSVRSRQTGDVLQMRGGTKKVKKAHIDNKVPKEKRDSMPVITDEKGIVCAFGCGVDLNYAVSESTKNTVCIRYERVGV